MAYGSKNIRRDAGLFEKWCHETGTGEEVCENDSGYGVLQFESMKAFRIGER